MIRTPAARATPWLVLALVAACATVPPPRVPTAAAIVHEQSRWVAVSWDALPGWADDKTLQAWPALLRSCDRPAVEWSRVCEQARHATPRDDQQARAWLMQWLRPYRVESLQGEENGLVTGYFEPVVDARRRPDVTFRYALYSTPPDLATRRPYWTRQELETLPAARAALTGRELAWVADPLDALLLQVQGSGRLHVVEPSGLDHTTRVTYGGDNGQPYRSIGRWLIEHGELPQGQASWPAIRDWASRHPDRVAELIATNPRFVFFREEPLTDPTLGPRGAQGVPLTPGRSIAVDRRSIPYGAAVWVDTSEPLSSQPLRRLVLAQDTGSAITGAVRADYFWGWGTDAAARAGRMRQPLRLWVLWPATAVR